MLSFLRNNSVKIVYGIVIAFVVTTFMGVVFFNESFQSSKDASQTQKDMDSAVATIGNTPVSEQVFLLEYRRIRNSVPNDVEINSNILEALQLNALQKAIESTMLLEIGKKQKIKVSRSEINSSIYSVMDQFGVHSKKELKVTIQANGGSYDGMLNQLKNDLIAAKVRQALVASVEIKDIDIPHLNYEFKIKELFIPKRSTQNAIISDDTLYQKSMGIRSKITNSNDLDREIKLQNKQQSSPQSRWLNMAQLSPDLARAIYSMNIKEISQPIRTLNGYFILELKDKRELGVTNQISEQNLQTAWERQVFYEFLYDVQNGREIKVVDLNLKALKLKNEGRFDDAIQAYQGVISKDPSNPYPNVLISKIYLMKGDLSKAKQELLKAEIKESLISEDIVLPEIHVLLAEIYNQEGFSTKKNSQYDKLLKSEGVDINVLTYLKQVFETSKDNRRLAKVNQLIEEKHSTETVLEDVSTLTEKRNDDFLQTIDE